MAQWEIVVDDEDAHEADRKPWTASIFEVTETGRSGEAHSVGIGATPMEAVTDAVGDWAAMTR